MCFSLRRVIVFFSFLIIITCFVFCGTSNQQTHEKEQPPVYLNLNDTVKYVGITTCKLCHQDIYNSFIKTGMGLSFDKASKQKSSAKFDRHAIIYDKYSDFYYQPFWDNDSLKFKEFRLQGKDTVFKRIETANYIVGSGQHTNSHILNRNGYLYQIPMTFYTQEGKWDLPPGFEKGFNSRFSRKIGLECMSCHNSYPSFIKGSENKYSEVPTGINCERCHGPGEMHVKEKMAGHLVDTSRYIDYSIVNPAKLSIDKQFDVCQRCHLQGNAVLKENKSFYDFRPGMELSDMVSVFMPKYKGAEEDFIMASHAARLKMSQCFIKSFQPEDAPNSLKPYKQSLTCVTCHNPHISVKVTGKEVFNNACKNCHGGRTNVVCKEEESKRMEKQDNCVSCHMPRSGSIDIPHVTVTDHFIRKPVSKSETDKIRKFIGLYSVNEKNPSNIVLAQAYINQFEKFDSNPVLLDTAMNYLEKDHSSNLKKVSVQIRLYFLKHDQEKIIALVNQFGKDNILHQLQVKSWDNEDAWTCYRIGDAYHNLKKYNDAFLFFKQADQLSPYNPEFKNKLAGTLMSLEKIAEAKKCYEDILVQNPEYAPAYCNLGYIYLLQGNAQKADQLYDKTLSLDPDYELAKMNKVGVMIYQKKYPQARAMLKTILSKHPENKQAKEVFDQLANLK